MELMTLRLTNLRRVLLSYESQQALAAAAGLSVQYLNQLLMGHRNMGEKTARKLEKVLKLESGWFDRERDAPPRDPVTGEAGLSRRAVKVGQMFDRLSPDRQDAMQKILDALAQSVADDDCVARG